MNKKPEDKAREKIDELLKQSGWEIQDIKELNIHSSLGVAIREFPLKAGTTDYLLFVDGVAAGVVEAKKEGTTLSGVAGQSAKYTTDLPDNLPHVKEPLPFAYESTGIETYFRDNRDPNPRSRRVYSFHSPEILKEIYEQSETLRAKLKKIPPLITQGLRNCQIVAIKKLEESFADDRPRALIQMATGSGKTYTAVSSVYRLIKHADAKRVLFLVDRNNLGRQTLKEFQQYITPDDGRKFTEIYNVQHLSTNKIDKVSRVCITTIQRLYSMLRGEQEFDPELEEQSLYNMTTDVETPRDVVYNSEIPIETFDFIITDECHRSIYNLWRQVLEYFDAYIIGLTATPSKQTLGFFNQNLVTEYTHDRAVADGVNVGYEVYRIKTGITESGSKVEAGYYVDKRNKQTRKTRWEKLDEDMVYDAGQLDRDVVAPNQIRTIIRAFKENLFTEIFPGRTEVPKTLIFAKDDSHAEDIVHIIREEFGKGNDFCKKITYRTTGEKPEDLIAEFRNSYNPRIAVSVDMISTGTDIKPLECLLFMRDVKSRVYFEQMKGRGTRVIESTDFRVVTPDALNKTHFVIVDAIGVCETDKTDSRPMERKRNVPFDKLLLNIALGNRSMDNLTTLAGRLASLDREISEKDRAEIEKTAQGKTFKQIINTILDAVDPDKQTEKAKQKHKTAEPTKEQIKKATDELTKEACTIFNNPKFRNILIDIKKKSEQTIDTVSIDEVTFAGYDEHAKEKAKSIVDTFKKFIQDNKSEITALQMIYSKPYTSRHITYEQIKQLAEAIQKPPYYLTSEQVWMAYERLEKSKVKKAGPHKLLTDIVSLVRFTIGEKKILEPFENTVAENFNNWLIEQEKIGRKFTPEQMDWLIMIKNYIATSFLMEESDFDDTPFFEKGGRIKAQKVFGKEIKNILQELNDVLTV